MSSRSEWTKPDADVLVLGAQGRAGKAIFGKLARAGAPRGALEAVTELDAAWRSRYAN